MRKNARHESVRKYKAKQTNKSPRGSTTQPAEEPKREDEARGTVLLTGCWRARGGDGLLAEQCVV